jgi:predicted nucleic acid-binding protein
MPLAYLLDTDVIIHHFQKRETVSQRLAALWPAGLGVSIISVAELWEGVLYSKDPPGRQQQLQEFLSLVQILELNPEICKRFGALRGKLRQEGGPSQILICSLPQQPCISI